MTAKRSKILPANLQVVKSANLSLIFGLIHKRAPISRASLAKLSGLTPTTVSALTDELIAEGMVQDGGMKSTSATGRPAVMLEICPSGGYVVGIELSAEGFSAGLYDLTGSLVRERIGELDEMLLISALDDMIGREISVERLLGICIGIPAVIDKAEMRVISSTLIAPEKCNAVFDALSARFPTVRIQMGNESSFCAYIERAALSESVKSLVYVDINEGIGSGIILDNRIFTGAFGNAGELGHVSIDANGEKCRCGNHGCLETVASVTALLRRMREVTGNDKLSLADISCALNDGDECTVAVVSEICRLLAHGLNNMINILNPEAIVLGGAVCQLGDRFISTLTDELKKISFAPNMKKISITKSKVSGNAVTRGAARYLLDGIFNSAGFWID